MGRNYFGLCGQRPSQEVTSELRRCGRGKEKKSCTLSVQAAGAATELALKEGEDTFGVCQESDDIQSGIRARTCQEDVEKATGFDEEQGLGFYKDQITGLSVLVGKVPRSPG